MLRLFKKKVKENWVIDGLVTLHDAYEGICITGGTGAGKSSGPMRECILNLLRLGAGFLVLTAKPTDIAMWAGYCRQASRTKDLEIFEDGHCLNFLQHECEKGGVESARGLLYDLYDAVNANKGKGSDPFWPNSAKTLLGHGVSALFLGSGKVSVRELVAWLHDLPVSATQWNSDEWGKGVVYQSIKEPGDDIDRVAAYDYIRNFWLKQDDKLKGGVLAEAKSILDPLMTGSVSPLVNGTSTITPCSISDGKVVVIGTPVLSHREPGRLINLAWKLSTQRHLLRKNDSPVCICTDEANWFAVPGVDALVQSVARASKIVNMMAFQNIPLLQRSLGGDNAETEVNGWLANFQCMIACQNACPITNRYFSNLVGEEMQLTFSGSSGGEPYDPMGDWLGEKPKGFSASWSEHMMPILQPNQLTKLQKGGVPHFKVHAYVYLGGRRINGRTFVMAEFSQK